MNEKQIAQLEQLLQQKKQQVAMIDLQLNSELIRRTLLQEMAEQSSSSSNRESQQFQQSRLSIISHDSQFINQEIEKVRKFISNNRSNINSCNQNKQERIGEQDLKHRQNRIGNIDPKDNAEIANDIYSLWDKNNECSWTKQPFAKNKEFSWQKQKDEFAKTVKMQKQSKQIQIHQQNIKLQRQRQMAQQRETIRKQLIQQAAAVEKREKNIKIYYPIKHIALDDTLKHGRDRQLLRLFKQIRSAKDKGDRIHNQIKKLSGY